MKVYQIDYDLRKHRDYESLYARIRSYPAWCRPLESSWVIQTDKSAAQVRDHLLGAMDPDDGLLVTRLSNEAAWHGINKDVGPHLKKMLQGAVA